MPFPYLFRKGTPVDPPEVGNNLRVGLKAFWEFEEESGGISDSSGRGHSLVETANAVPSIAGGIRGNTRVFGGADTSENYFATAPSSDFEFGRGPWGLSAWVKIVNDEDAIILGKSDFTDNEHGLSWLLMYDHATPDNRFLFAASTDGGGIGLFDENFHLFPFVPDGGITTGIWYHVFATGQGSYVAVGAKRSDDGSPVYTLGVDYLEYDSAELGLFGLWNNSGLGVSVGNWVDNTGFPSTIDSLEGNVDDAGVWRRILTPCNLKHLFNAGAALAPSEFDSLPCA